MTIVDCAPVRCSAWTADAHVDPIGSTDGYEFFLVIEWPQPWPRDVGLIPQLEQLNRMVAARGGRLQCVVPPNAGGAKRIAWYQRSGSDGLVGPFRCFEVLADLDDIAHVAAKLLSLAFRPNTKATSTEVLICAHGRRDRCCGSLGTSLELSLRVRPDLADVRTGRTSHLGGHRFAPTALVLPDATLWAFVDALTLSNITGRNGDIRELARHYRGFAGIEHRPAQLLERQALIDIGWTWFDHRRSAHLSERGTWVLDAVAPTGERHRWEGTVGVSRQVAVPECGAPISAATKTESEYELVDVAHTTI